MIKKALERVYGKDYEIREQAFRCFVLVGTFMAVLAFLKCVFMMSMEEYLGFLIHIPVIVVEFILTFKLRKIDLAIDVASFVFILVSFPELFLLSGGLEGGGPLWFLLGMVLVFVCYSGKKLAFFLSLTIAAEGVVYFVAYRYPEIVLPLKNREYVYFDALFSLILVGVLVGIILKVKLHLFRKERANARKRQEELKEIGESKNRFFASMSHEIRAPINTVLGLNEMILRESQEETTKGYAQNVKNAGTMLLTLVNDILDLAQIEVKKMEIVPTEYDTVELFQDLVDMVRIQAQEKNLELQAELDHELPSVLYGDTKRITQVILNLLTNAVKYTNQGTVTLEVEIGERREDEIDLVVSVSDTGIGIQKGDLEHLFDRFLRVDVENNRSIEGSGLGLAIVKQLVDLMGGQLKVDSIYTKGSTFTVVLPQRIEEAEPIGDVNLLARSRVQLGEYQRSFEAPEARLLIVDDNETGAMVTSKLLSETKMQIDFATSGEACLAMTKNKYYHVILMDYRMPGMNGIQTLERIRRQENGLCKDSSVIVLSASSMTESGSLLLDSGFDGYLEKPISGVYLEREVLEHLPDDIVVYRYDQDEEMQDDSPHRFLRRKRKKVCVTTNCVCDVPEKLLEKYHVALMYSYIQTGNGRFEDVREIDSMNLMEYMKDGVTEPVIETASMEQYEAFFAERLTKAENVVHITMSRNARTAFDTAVAASQCIDHVHIIDSGQMSCGVGMLVLYAARLAANGMNIVQVREKIDEQKKKIHSFFILPNTWALRKNGRMSTFVGKLWDRFSLRPIMHMVDGKVTRRGVCAGSMEKVWRKEIQRSLKKKKEINLDMVCISHVGCSERQLEYIRSEILLRVPFDRVYIQRASASTACNSGIGGVGIAFFKK